MRHTVARIFALTALTLVGCKTLRTDAGTASRPVAAWSELQVVNEDGRKVPAPPELIVASLKRVGIAATADDTGLHIAPEDEDRAAEALLTDQRLTESGILVFIPVSAGTGRRTVNGIEFTMPTTQPHK